MRANVLYLLLTAFLTALMSVADPLASAESLEEMAAAAKKHDARYLAAKADCEAKVARIGQAFSRLLPGIEVGGNLARQHLTTTYDNRRFTKIDRNYDANGYWARVVQPLLSMDAWVGYRQSQKVGDYARYALQQAEVDLVLRLARAYYDVLYAEESISLLETESDFLAVRWQAAEALHRSGALAGTEPLQIQARHALVKAEKLQAQWELVNKRRVLIAMIGPEVGGPDPIADDEVDMDLDSMEEWRMRVRDNCQVRAANVTWEIAKEDLAASQSRFWPVIEAIGSYENNLTGPTAALPVETYNQNYSVGLSCTWPLFSGGGTLAACQESARNLEKARREHVAAEREAELQIAEAYSGIAIGKERLHALDQACAAALAVVRAMESGHAVGARSLIQLLDARQQWLEARQKRSQALYQVLMDWRRLRLAAGDTAVEL